MVTLRVKHVLFAVSCEVMSSCYQSGRVSLTRRIPRTGIIDLNAAEFVGALRSVKWLGSGVHQPVAFAIEACY